MLAAVQPCIHEVVPSPRTALKRIRATRVTVDANFIFDVGVQKADVCQSLCHWKLMKWFDAGVVISSKQREALFILHQRSHLHRSLSGVNSKVRSAESTASCQYHCTSWPSGMSSYTVAPYHVWIETHRELQCACLQLAASLMFLQPTVISKT
jgi:hypothetical protein